MTKIKNVVKVMNFHSLLRVDAAKKQAEKYFFLEDEVTNMIDNIVNNRNFILDKKSLQADPQKPKLNIYIGSDYGFCSNYNSQVNDRLLKDDESYKVIIGKKMRKVKSNVLLQCSKEEFDKDNTILDAIVEEGIRELKYSEINIIYNHYKNASEINLDVKKVFPVELKEKDKDEYNYDFICETSIDDLLVDLFILYIDYEIKITTTSANAAENVMRQNTTSESLKKIDEREQEYLKVYRKEKRAKEFRKVIENFTKLNAG